MESTCIFNGKCGRRMVRGSNVNKQANDQKPLPWLNLFERTMQYKATMAACA